MEGALGGTHNYLGITEPVKEEGEEGRGAFVLHFVGRPPSIHREDNCRPNFFLVRGGCVFVVVGAIGGGASGSDIAICVCVCACVCWCWCWQWYFAAAAAVGVVDSVAPAAGAVAVVELCQQTDPPPPCGACSNENIPGFACAGAAVTTKKGGADTRVAAVYAQEVWVRVMTRLA